MESPLFESFGWRDIVMALVVATAIYMAVALLRLWQLRRQRRQAPAAPSEPSLAEAPVELPLDPGTIEAGPAPVARYAPESPAAKADAGSDFGERLFRAGIENDLQHLRGDLARVRDELAALRAELGALQQQVTREQGARAIAPAYSEAMGMALQGLDARAVADRCGISIGEAELVVALTRRDQGYDKTKDEAEDERNDPRDETGR